MNNAFRFSGKMRLARRKRIGCGISQSSLASQIIGEQSRQGYLAEAHPAVLEKMTAGDVSSIFIHNSSFRNHLVQIQQCARECGPRGALDEVARTGARNRLGVEC